MNKVKLKIDFNDANALEVQLRSGTWARVTYLTFRSYAGPRKVGGVEYDGPLYYEGTNRVYEGDRSTYKIISIENLNRFNKQNYPEEVRSYDRDEKYKKAILGL